jgi:hypothetical protein
MNISLLTQVLKKSGRVGLYSEGGVNLVTNTHFMVDLNEDDFWKVQAALQFKDSTGWYEKITKFWAKRENLPDMVGLRNKTIESAKNILAPTGLISQNDDYFYYHLAHPKGYVNVNKQYLDIVWARECDAPAMLQGDPCSPIVINGVHLITPVLIGDQNKYLKPCAG